MNIIEEIKTYESRLLQAVKGNDIQALDSLLHDDLLFLNPMGQVLTKSMDLDTYRSGQLTIEALTSSSQQITLVNDTAIVRVKIKLKGQYREAAFDEHLQYLRVWTQAAGTWQVIAGGAARI